MPSSQSSIFTCTFCFHLSTGTPHILGRHARLSCAQCFAALIDLSICWVCGELIYRGDEAVSFGWCFWHRACYGCLLCGSRAICRGTPVQALYWDDDEEGMDGLDGVRRGESGGREIVEVPLCAGCVVEVEIDAAAEEEVVRRGLRRVEVADGGLTRSRWEAKEGIAKGGHSRRLRRSTGREPLFRQGMDGQYAEASIDCAVPSDSVIWVNIFDPINKPSFKPSPLKSIPLFMQRPVIPIIEPQRHASAVDTYLQSPLPLTPLKKNSVSAPGTLCPTTPAVSISRFSTPDRPRSAHSRSHSQHSRRPSQHSRAPSQHSQYPSQDLKGDEGPLDLGRQQAPAFIKEEPLKRPSSRLAPRHRRSQTRSSLYQTPPEYPDSTRQDPSLTWLDESSFRTQSRFPTHSSEYLERYQPLSTPATRRLEMLMEQSRSKGGRGEEEGVRGELRKFFAGQ